MPGIYKGPSDGVEELVDGYEDYAKSVIATRSTPDIRDGLKKVQRRVIYTGWKINKNAMIKCSTTVGRIMEIHPHGDGSVYGALCLLTDENGGCNVPYFYGDGNLGKVFLSDKPAAMRYPLVRINENGMDFFRDKEIMELVPSEEGDGEEPPVLLAPYPAVLVNGAMGIAVGTGTKMPSFNYSEVLDLTIKHIKEGGLTVEDIIKPDFPTGGVLVANEQELAKIMLTGKGKLKIRAKVEINGKEIRVLEVPYGKTVQSIVCAIHKSGIRDIVGASEATGRDSNFLVRIDCKTKRCVESVLMELYSKNILQNTFSSNILVVDDGEPLILGVHDIIKRWVKWRESVLQKKFDLIIQNNTDRCEVLDYFLRLCSVEEHRDTYIATLVNNTDHEADTYLRSLFPDIPPYVVDWIRDRKVSAFRKAGKYQKEYDNLKDTISLYKHYKESPDEYIVEELQELKQKKAGKYPRKTDITYQDYKFSKISDSSEIEDTSYCVYTLFENGFITKTRNFLDGDSRKGILREFPGKSNSMLIGFDNAGRLLRISGKDIPFTGYKDNGMYLPKYFEVPSDLKGYRILYLSLIDGSKKMLLYKDGYVGYFDTMEFVGKKNIKIVDNGVCKSVVDKLLHVFECDEIPMALMLIDNSGNKMRVGVIHPNDLPERSRTSRAKVVSGNSDMNIEYFYRTDIMEMMKVFPYYENYLGKLKILKEDIEVSIEAEEGRYLELCSEANFE